MSPLKKLWQALEEVSGAQAAFAEWRQRLGTDLESIRAMLIPTDRRAGVLLVGGDPYSIYRVVCHSDSDIVGVPDGGGPTITLSKQDILIYRLDHQKMLRDVAAVLGIKYVLASVDGVSDTYRIGSYCPFAGHAFPVFFTIPLESRDLYAVAESLTARCIEPFILLAPTGNRMQPECESLLKSRKVCFMALTDAIDHDARGASAAAQRCLEAFVRDVVPQSQDARQATFFLTPPNATWDDVRIKFTDGETVTVHVAGVTGQYLFSDMGMADGRSKKPDKQWQLLRAFAKGFGSLTWEASDADPKNQKRREILAKNLKAFFRIDGDPIQYVEKTKGWQTLFTVEPDV